MVSKKSFASVSVKDFLDVRKAQNKCYQSYMNRYLQEVPGVCGR